MSRIFEKGFTGSNGRNVKKSTGMGLYLCRRLCEKLGIAIEAESVRGEGTEDDPYISSQQLSFKNVR